MSNKNYNDPFLISKVLLIIQKQHPELGVGEYKKHTPSADGRGLLVRLTNGKILVTYDALANYYEAGEIPDYTEFMIQTFVPDTLSQEAGYNRTKSRIEKLLRFFNLKEVRMK